MWHMSRYFFIRPWTQHEGTNITTQEGEDVNKPQAFMRKIEGLGEFLQYPSTGSQPQAILRAP